MSYLTGRSKDKLLPVMMHTLSMSSSTFSSFSSDVMGKYDNVFCSMKREGFEKLCLQNVNLKYYNYIQICEII